MIIGAKLGSAITAALGGMASNLAGKRLAMAHLITNAGTVVVGVAIIYQMIWLTDINADFFHIAEDDYLIKLAIFNTVFNLLGVAMFLPFAHQLEAALIKYIKFEKTTADQPIYLLQDALATPSTAVGAVRKEVQRLFENAYGLLAHGISLRRPVIDSNESLADAVKYTRRIMPLDVDDQYEDKIKSLHSAIVGFIGEAQTLTLTRETTEELYVLRQASRDIVEAVKAMKHMHKNLARYGASNQIAIRENYDAIRLQVAKLLRELRAIIKSPEDITNLSFDALAHSLKNSGDKLMENLDSLIKNQRIQPAIATSIMNDEAYVRDLGAKLISATKALLVRPEHRNEPGIAFTEQEVEALTSLTSAETQS